MGQRRLDAEDEPFRRLRDPPAGNPLAALLLHGAEGKRIRRHLKEAVRERVQVAHSMHEAVVRDEVRARLLIGR